MVRTSALTAAILGLPLTARVQQAQPAPDGPGKDTFVAVCGGCHDINRARAGYTPDGWHTVMHMMKNFETPIPPEDGPELTEYLIKAFPERPRPAGRDHRRPGGGFDQAVRGADARLAPASIRSPPRTARSGGPGSYPTSSAVSIRRTARSGNAPSRPRTPARTAWSRTRTATSGSPATTPR